MSETASTSAVDALAAAREPSDDELNVRVERLVLDVVSNAHRKLDTRIDTLLTDGRVTQSMSEPPSLELEFIDHDLEVLSSGTFAYRLDVDLDDHPFRLVTVGLGDDEILTLTLEHRLVAEWREHTKPLKVSRNESTRAEFLYRMLVRELPREHVRFVSPELHKRQAIASERKAPQKHTKAEQRGKGIASDAKFTVKGKQATKAQKAQIERALTVAESLGASEKAKLALLVAGIGESGFAPIMNAGGSGYGGVFQGDVSARFHYFKITDTEGMAHAFLVGGKGFQGGGALALARGPNSPGWIATTVEASGQPPGFYDRWRREADEILKAWQGGGSFARGESTYYKRYEFTRGQPGQKEDSWAAARRLADEVRWRLFVVGRRTVYYVTDDYLIDSRPRYTIDPQTTGYIGLTGDLEVGRRTIVVRGRREPRPSEATLRVRLNRWAAPPGTVIELADFGPYDGRWLVDSISRPIFDAEGEVQLRQPQKALPEPRTEKATRTAKRKRGGSSPNARRSGKVLIAPGANRPGVGLHKPLLDFLELVAEHTSQTLTIVTGTNHNQFVAGSSNQSDHWTGDAADLGVGGDARVTRAAAIAGDNIATACLVALGIPYGQARQWATSGALNFGIASNHDWQHHRVQIGWRTMVGGNHFNHVHVGVEP